VSPLDPRAQQLYDEGARLLDELWDDDAGLVRAGERYGPHHSSRESVTYTEVLLRRGGAENTARAERILANVAALQEIREGDAHYGNFRWYAELPVVTDLNAVEFVLDGLNALLIEHKPKLSASALECVRSMITLGLEEIDRLDVHPSYTNIVLSDICNSVLGGQAIGDETYVERGRRRLDEWFAFTNASGAPHEFNSPTYAAVDIARMAHLAEHAQDQAIALKARIAEERLWLHAATHNHPALAQLAGPHCRSYRDGWTGAGGYLKLQLWRVLGDENLRRVTPYWGADIGGVSGREEGHTGVAVAPLHCPPEALWLLHEKRYPCQTIETSDVAAGLDITTYMTERYALGTASRGYAVGEPREPNQQQNSLLLHFRRDADPGYGTLFCRYVANDNDVGRITPEAGVVPPDLWDEGMHVASQHRSRAIVAYGLRPRLRPVRSYKLTVCVLGISNATEIWRGDEQLTAFPARIMPGDPLVVAEGGVYIALIPLEPTDMGSDAAMELNVRDAALTLDLYNCRGPEKSFWEYQSLSGAFYKGNVRNAFVLEVAERGDFPNVAAFRRHIADARIADSVDEEYTREIAYSSDGGAIAVRYSLWDMRLIERRFDGIPFVAPMGRAGAIDGSGPQWVQGRDTLTELAGARLMAGRAPKWFFADRDAGRYIIVNPSDERAPVSLETAGGAVLECDEFGFGRIDLDEKAGAIALEATGEIGELRLRIERTPQLTINGVDVTDSLVGPDADGVRTFAGVA
jgi:hypothetical protein